MSDRVKPMVPFLWHGAFLALTMAIIEPNTVLPALLSELTDSTVVFGVAYSLLLGAPLVFNLWFSRIQQGSPTKKKFLLLENVTALSLMVLPFYMVFVKQTFPEATGFLGLYVVAQTSGALVSNFLWAFLSRRMGSKNVMGVCIAMGALLPLVAWGLSLTGPAWFAILFLLVGFVVSGRNVGFEPYLLEIAPTDQRTLYLGIRGTLNILLIFLPLAGGLFIQTFGFVPTFLVVSSGMVLAVVLSFLKGSSGDPA